MSQALKLDENGFQTEVLDSDQPVLVDFWAEWCGPCRQLSPVIDEIATDYSGRIKVAKVNVDENQNLAAQYGASSIPLVLFFKNGEVVDRQLGLVPKETFDQKIEEIL